MESTTHHIREGTENSCCLEAHFTNSSELRDNFRLLNNNAYMSSHSSSVNRIFMIDFALPVDSSSSASKP
jgi:hypothetical protein